MYKNDIEPNLEEGNMLMFAHGFNIHFGSYRTAEECRCYHDRTEGSGTYRTFRVPGRKGNSVSDSCRAGCNRKSTGYGTCLWSWQSAEQEQAFLRQPSVPRPRLTCFGEQAVLCGGVCALMQAGFETLWSRLDMIREMHTSSVSMR